MDSVFSFGGGGGPIFGFSPGGDEKRDNHNLFIFLTIINKKVILNGLRTVDKPNIPLLTQDNCNSTV